MQTKNGISTHNDRFRFGGDLSVFITILTRQILKDRKEYFECYSIKDN